MFCGRISWIKQTLRRQAARRCATHAQRQPALQRAWRCSDQNIVLEHGGGGGLSQPVESPRVQAEVVQVQADPQGHGRILKKSLKLGRLT